MHDGVPDALACVRPDRRLPTDMAARIDDLYGQLLQAEVSQTARLRILTEVIIQSGARRLVFLTLSSINSDCSLHIRW